MIIIANAITRFDGGSVYRDRARVDRPLKQRSTEVRELRRQVLIEPLAIGLELHDVVDRMFARFDLRQ